jgi:hypothetical protein
VGKNKITGGNNKMKRVLTVALLVTLALVLMVGVALPGLAAEDEAVSSAEHKPWPRVLRGVVAGTDENQGFFTVKVGEREVEIEVNEGTKYFTLSRPHRPIPLRPAETDQLGVQEDVQLRVKQSIQNKRESMDQAPPQRALRPSRNPELAPVDDQELAPDLSASGVRRWIPGNWQWLLKLLRQFGQEASYDDIDAGDRIVVGIVPRDGNPLAKVVLIMERAPDQVERVVGTVLDIDEAEKTITIEPNADATAATADAVVVLTYDNHTVFVLQGTPSLEEGMKVVATYVEEDDVLLAKRVMTRVSEPESVE